MECDAGRGGLGGLNYIPVRYLKVRVVIWGEFCFASERVCAVYRGVVGVQGEDRHMCFIVSLGYR